MIDSDGSSIFGKTTIMNEMNLKGLYDGNFYHVCTNGLEQVTLLKDEEDFKTAWEVVAFILMSNHMHQILACKDLCSLCI